MITKLFKTWGLKPWQYNTLYALMRIRYRKPRAKRDYVLCFGIGYPHWKGRVFRVKVIFNNGDLGLDNSIRVSSKDYGVIGYKKYARILQEYKKATKEKKKNPKLKKRRKRKKSLK